jgi:hypothetical protein
LVKNSKNIVDFYIKKIIQSDKNIKQKVLEMEEKILPFVSEILNPIERGKYISKISKGFEIEQDFVLEALENTKKKNVIEKKDEEKRTKNSLKKFDIFSKNNIIEKTKKSILKQLTAIYYWQKNMVQNEP